VEHWHQRYDKTRLCVIPWLEQLRTLDGLTVLEYGCGTGAISCAFGAKVGRHIGVDIDEDAVAEGLRRVAHHDLDNVELMAFPTNQVLDAVAEHSGEIDIFLLYAVIEHLTADERTAVLEAARTAVRPEGLIVVCELPNRLLPFDSHTSQLPFYGMLPNELALELVARSPRGDFRQAIHEAQRRGEGSALTTLARWGRPGSYHEFELVFDNLSRHVVASNYEPVMLPVREILPEELELANRLTRYRPDLAPCWSRYWQDVVLTPEPCPAPPTFLRPWSVSTSPDTRVGLTNWGALELPLDAELTVSLPSPTRRLVVGAEVAEELLTVTANAEEQSSSVTTEPQRPLDAPPHLLHPRYVTLELEQPASELRVRLSSAGHISFIGYDA
jgi:ubiquinone/menaquinone biosynthesis C-methylase UbiE